MIGIYKITSPTNKIYIGQSVNINKRFNSYYKLQNVISQRKLYNSFLKYGIENHKFEILEECDVILLNERERFYQDLFNVISDGLNCRLTETNDKSGKLSKETIDLLVKINTGKKASLETKLKVSLNHSRHNLGKKHKLESIKKMSLNRKNKLTLGDNGRAKKVICTETNIIYSCCKEASILLGYKYSTLRCMLNGSDKNKTSLKYI
jgi:group I intron endonuclease